MKDSAGGVLVGRRHSEGGIKAINKSSGQPLEMEGGEVVITRNAVSDSTKREFEGEMLTNKEILSRINTSGGGVAFAEGGEVHKCACSGKEYKYGGKVMKDFDILESMQSMYPARLTHQMLSEKIIADHYAKGGYVYESVGMMTVTNKSMPSMKEFKRVGEPVKSPYYGENELYFPITNNTTGVTMYYKNGNKRSAKITTLLAYKTYLYDNFGVNFKDLPVQIQNGLSLGKQTIIDNYINS